MPDGTHLGRQLPTSDSVFYKAFPLFFTITIQTIYYFAKKPCKLQNIGCLF